MEFSAAGKAAWGTVCFSGWGIKRRFCTKYNIDYGNFSRALREYQNHSLDPAWIAALVLEFDLSADWILTGRGDIKSKETNVLPM